MGKPQARELSAAERQITGSRPEHIRTPLPLATNGVVTNVHITACGEQEGRIKAVAEGTRLAMLQVDLQTVTMQFISCQQVQLVLGLFAYARQAKMGMATVHRLPGVMPRIQSSTDVQTTMSWTRNPMGTAHRETFAHPVTKKVYPYVQLNIAPLTFSLMDTTAIETMIDTMRKAHKMATVLFDDGHQFSRNSAAPSWRPPAENSYRITGTGWIERGPTPTNDR
ncbi:hypothetical protein [Nocardia sp. 348MFTsu5.1]|uniref:hypothetical protein n=1 Tax=Nocardia sp. 348MFTsu5.1 TaxID=1172185 RepID=UPI00035E6D70|nr:hypothetical protein [Nocardia sp. 348MFTsu5.1]